MTSVTPSFPLVEFSEDTLRALEAFCKDRPKTVPAALDSVIVNISRTGQTCYPWDLLKKLIAGRIEETIDRMVRERGWVDSGGETAASRKAEVLRLLAEFPEAPFTVQRLCELLVGAPTASPARYTRASSFVFAVEKMLNVSTTQRSLTPAEVAEYNRAVSEAAATGARPPTPPPEQEQAVVVISHSKAPSAASEQRSEAPVPMDTSM